MGRACSTHGKGEKCMYKVLVGKVERRRPLRRPRRRREDHIKMDLREIEFGAVAEDRD
jgi:hypothetical protein